VSCGSLDSSYCVGSADPTTQLETFDVRIVHVSCNLSHILQLEGLEIMTLGSLPPEKLILSVTGHISSVR
jgi:hypothetical protein